MLGGEHGVHKGDVLVGEVAGDADDENAGVEDGGGGFAVEAVFGWDGGGGGADGVCGVCGGEGREGAVDVGEGEG